MLLEVPKIPVMNASPVVEINLKSIMEQVASDMNITRCYCDPSNRSLSRTVRKESGHYELVNIGGCNRSKEHQPCDCQ